MVPRVAYQRDYVRNKKTGYGVHSLALHPSSERSLVAGGDAHGHVGLWDANACEQHSFKYHRSNVACMNFNLFKTNELLTTSHDGSVRCFDLDSQVVQLLYGRAADQYAGYKPTLYHAQRDSSTILVAMHQGRVGVLDTRQKCTKKMSKVMQVIFTLACNSARYGKCVHA